jgi:hypothetical protein
VEDLITSPTPKFNTMSRFLTGSKSPNAAHLFRNVEDEYLIVSPSHRVNDTLNALIPLIGGRPIEDGLHRNKTSEPSSEDVGALKDRFERVNALDVELAHFVEANYERWLTNLPDRLARLERRHLP